MKAKVIRAFKDASKGVKYEVGQIADIDAKCLDKFEALGLIEKIEIASEPKKTPKKTVKKVEE